MALFNPMAGKLPAVKLKTPKNIGEEVGSWIGVGPKAKPGALTGGSDQPFAGGAIQKPVMETVQASPLEIGPPGGKTATIADISNPYAEAAKMATGEISGMLPQYKQLYGTGAGALTGLIGDLQAQARGQAGPGMSLGQALLQQGLTQGTGAVQSQLASQRGLSAAQRARMASNQIAALQGQTAQQAGILGLQQQLAAQEQLGKLGTGAATLGSDAQLRGAGLLTGSSQELERMRQNIAAANQAAAAQDKARTVQAVTSVLGGASQVGAAYAGKAHGGRIDGVAPYAGDTPKNDVVPANLSPGEIVIPRSAAMSKKDAKKFIDALDDWDEEPSYGKVLKARQKKNYADGGMIPNDEQMMQEAGQAYLEKQRAPYPMVEKAKGAFDEFLASRVVEPLAQRGYPTLGAALATVPSTAMEAMVPSTPDELMQTVIPFPGAKLTKKAEKVIAEEGLEKTIAKQSLERGEKMKSKLAEQVLAEKQKKIPSKEQRPKLRDVNEQIDELSEPNWSESAVKDASEPYSGNIHNNVWQKDFASGVEQKPQLVGDLKGTLGKEVPKGGTDPFAWMDTKYGATKKALEQNYDKPLTINTRSDLIAHDDYIALLNPSKHKINIHVLSPENDRITRILEPGAPSTKRRLAAAKKLQDMGFDVTIVQDILKHPKLSENMRKDVSSFADLGEFHQRMNNMFLDDSAVERLKKVLGDYATKE